eukprot:1586740-Pleurochrysis_carterae.AAC.1
MRNRKCLSPSLCLGRRNARRLRRRNARRLGRRNARENGHVCVRGAHGQEGAHKVERNMI